MNKAPRISSLAGQAHIFPHYFQFVGHNYITSPRFAKAVLRKSEREAEGRWLGKSSKLPKLGSANDARDPLVGGMYGDTFDGTTIGKRYEIYQNMQLKIFEHKYLKIYSSQPIIPFVWWKNNQHVNTSASVAGPCGAPPGSQPGPSLRSLSPARDRHQKGLTWADPALGLAMVLGCLGGAHKLD